MSWSPFASSPHGWSPFSPAIEAYVFTPGADQPYEANTRALVDQEWSKGWPMLYADVLGVELAKTLLTALALAWYRADKGTHAFVSETVVPVAYIAKARQFAEWLFKRRENDAYLRDLAKGLIATAWDGVPFGVVDWAWVRAVGIYWPESVWHDIASEFATPWVDNPGPPRFSTLDPAAPLVSASTSAPAGQSWADIPFENPNWSSTIPFGALPWTKSTLMPSGSAISLTRNADGSFVSDPKEFLRRARLLVPCPPGQSHDPMTGRCYALSAPLPSLPAPPTPIVGGANEACPPPNLLYPATGECLSPAEIEAKKKEAECLAKGGIWNEEMYTCSEPEKPPPEQPPPGVEHVSPQKRCRAPNAWDRDLRKCLTPAQQEELKRRADNCARQGQTFDKRSGSCVTRDTGTSTTSECKPTERLWSPTGECVALAEYERRAKLSGQCQERGGTFDPKTLACSKPEPEAPPLSSTTDDSKEGESSGSVWPYVLGLGVLAVGGAFAVRFLSTPSIAEGTQPEPEPPLD